MGLPLNEEQAFSLIRGLIYQVCGIPPENIGRHDSLIRDLAMDSVELIDLLMQLEEHHLVIQESQINSKLTVEQLAYRLMGKE